jgi:NTE family protein
VDSQPRTAARPIGNEDARNSNQAQPFASRWVPRDAFPSARSGAYAAAAASGIQSIAISSVSRRSITAGLLALKWPKLSFDTTRLQEDFKTEIVSPLRSLASDTIDEEAIVLSLILPGRVSDRAAASYQRHLFADGTLQDLPDSPRVVINATNVQSGVLWRFIKPYMCDYRVGEGSQPNVNLSIAVAASAAFPPVLSPV